jgi:hypothetical protein
VKEDEDATGINDEENWEDESNGYSDSHEGSQ